MNDDLDLSSFRTWKEGLPDPDWQRIWDWLESDVEPDSRGEMWYRASRWWLDELAEALGSDYETVESENFLLLAPAERDDCDAFLRAAERCRAMLLGALPEIATFNAHGMEVVLWLRDVDDYYRYIALNHPDGDYGDTVGVHFRGGYPHVALYGRKFTEMESTLAHELTHVSLSLLSMPKWLEEGLAQVFEHDAAGGELKLIDLDLVRRHKRYWKTHGLGDFWSGEGFWSPGEVQKLSYELAEVLTRTLLEEGRPQWFGWDRGAQRRLHGFLREADESDYGESACRKHLGRGLGDLAGTFLGPGDWSPCS